MYDRKQVIFLALATTLYAGDQYEFLDCAIEPSTRITRALQGRCSSHPNIPLVRGQEGTSLNWSGYVAVSKAQKENSVTGVVGTWKVPVVSPAAHHTCCAIWVGIDGHTSPTVEQIGTAHEWSNDKQVHYAWFEMYPDVSYRIVGFPVSPGDSITATVTYEGKHVFLLTMRNNTRKVYTVVPTSYTTSAQAQRSCAEWVVEAPSLKNTIVPLSRVSPVPFSGCAAVIQGAQGAINNHLWTHTGIDMKTNAHVTKARTSALSPHGQSFTVTWSHE